MNLEGNTIFITGGGSGIGRALAAALHAKGNQVIISGRRASALEETTRAYPGMKHVALDVEDPKSIAAVAAKLIVDFPKLNVLVNNAGIMKVDGVGGVVDDALVHSIVATNLLGPIRMTSALILHLKKQPRATIINTTSGLAFVPMAATATYSATKAALHSYSISLRYLLKDTHVRVVELAPPYVQTELMGAHQAKDPRAMPLQEYVDESMRLLATDVDEVLVERVKMLRTGAGAGDIAAATKFNDMMSGH